MKNLLFVIASFFILIGCAPKEQVQTPKEPVKVVEVKEEPKLEVVEEEPEVTEPVVEVIEEETIDKVAIIYPSKIVGKYAKSTVNTITAYLIYNNKEFEIETFDTYNEDSLNILDQMAIIEERGFTKVIALFTQNGFNTLNMKDEAISLNVYFPLINKNEIITENNNFIFGGISYEDQLELLKTLSSEKSTMFYVKSYIGNKLKTIYENKFENEMIVKEIQRKNNKYKNIMEDERIIGSTVLLNTPIIKSSIIMSQLTAYEVEPDKVLSTQLNYNPLLMKLTQPRDRTSFYVVNSISNVDDYLVDMVKTLGANINYNWVDYSSLVGVDYLLTKKENSVKESLSVFSSVEVNEEIEKVVEVVETEIKEEISEEIVAVNEEENLIKTKVVDNQAVYKPVLYKGTAYGFEKVDLTTEEPTTVVED